MDDFPWYADGFLWMDLCWGAGALAWWVGCVQVYAVSQFGEWGLGENVG